MSASHTYLVLFFASILVLQYVAAESDELDFERVARAPHPKFIRFGRGGGAKFIRFGRSGANTWDDSVLDSLVEDELVNQVKRAGAKFIRFG